MDEFGVRGWAILPMADFVAARGLQDFDASLDLLAEMTKRATSEFAVRPFLVADPDRTLAHAWRWAGDANRHVRRLASEGTRPRLPWGMRLGRFVADPSPLIPLLTRLRDDPSDYVRRSVANSLNDIAKDHPDLVADIARDWLADAPPERTRLVRHACRTLVKRGHSPTLAALGYGPPTVRLSKLEVLTPEVSFGTALEFVAEIASEGAAQDIVLDYVIHHLRANGGTGAKVCKWKVLALGAGETLRLARRHPMRPVTTRRYYDGTHRVAVVANGVVLAEAEFELTGAHG
jgi:3-methyladenine DNA glycosylase AlkC